MQNIRNLKHLEMNCKLEVKQQSLLPKTSRGMIIADRNVWTMKSTLSWFLE